MMCHKNNSLKWFNFLRLCVVEESGGERGWNSSEVSKVFIAFTWNATRFSTAILVFLLAAFFRRTVKSYFRIFFPVVALSACEKDQGY